MKKPPFKPKIIKKSQLRVLWIDVLCRSAPTGPAGISHHTDNEGTTVLEYRDAEGLLRGVLVLYGERCTFTAPGSALILTDPEYQRQGIGSALLKEADRLGVPIDFAKQCYTRAGWRAVRKHLLRRDETKVAC